MKEPMVSPAVTAKTNPRVTSHDSRVTVSNRNSQELEMDLTPALATKLLVLIATQKGGPGVGFCWQRPSELTMNAQLLFPERAFMSQAKAYAAQTAKAPLGPFTIDRREP